ncbi:MAG: hypothetical protein LBV43_00660 [Prevotella sp.]|jgi:hypothetical protein|nr:hypothetical protein [Prevotella sp.]
MKKLKRILLDDLEQLSAAEVAKYVGGTGGNPPYIPPLITSSNYDYTTSFPPLGSSSSSGWSMSGSSSNSGWNISGGYNSGSGWSVSGGYGSSSGWSASGGYSGSSGWSVSGSISSSGGGSVTVTVNF